MSWNDDDWDIYYELFLKPREIDDYRDELWDIRSHRKFYHPRRTVSCALCGQRLALIEGEWKHRYHDDYMRYSRYCENAEQRGYL